jgi:hypothetical protein
MAAAAAVAAATVETAAAVEAASVRQPAFMEAATETRMPAA